MRLTWDQVFAWRLRRQYVEPRGDVDAVDVVTRLCGVQAQVTSSAELAVGLRQRTPGGVAAAVAEGALVKTWAMRGTLHLLPVATASAFLALLASVRSWEKPSWQRSFGATPAEVAGLVELVSELLDGAVLTRDELVSAIVVDARFAALGEQLRSGWGALLKPLAWQGALCHGPNHGNRVTFTSPRGLPGWCDLPELDEAANIVIPAYLAAHGPATPEVFDAWLSRGNLRKGVLRELFAGLGDRLVTVDVEGQSAYLLASDVDELATTKPTESIRLLGGFDQYLLAPGTKDTRLLPAEHRAKVSKAAGWISPIVLAGGRAVGVWSLDDDTVTITLFSGAPTPPRDALDAELAHVAQVTGRDSLALRVR